MNGSSIEWEGSWQGMAKARRNRSRKRCINVKRARYAVEAAKKSKAKNKRLRSGSLRPGAKEPRSRLRRSKGLRFLNRPACAVKCSERSSCLRALPPPVSSIPARMPTSVEQTCKHDLPILCFRLSLMSLMVSAWNCTNMRESEKPLQAAPGFSV